MNDCIISMDGSLHKNGCCGLSDEQLLVFCVWPSTSKAAEGIVYDCSLSSHVMWDSCHTRLQLQEF